MTAVMRKFYFNIRRDSTVFEDTSGVMLADVSAAWLWAIKDALTLISEGHLDRARYQYWIEICDAERCAIVTFPIGYVTMQ
jgi:hypothetical protein